MTAALIAVIIIFSCALNYLRKKYKNKLKAVEAYGMTGEEGKEYDEYAMEEMKNNMGNGKSNSFKGWTNLLKTKKNSTNEWRMK